MSDRLREVLVTRPPIVVRVIIVAQCWSTISNQEASTVSISDQISEPYTPPEFNLKGNVDFVLGSGNMLNRCSSCHKRIIMILLAQPKAE